MIQSRKHTALNASQQLRMILTKEAWLSLKDGVPLKKRAKIQFIEAIIELFLDRSSRVEENNKEWVFGQRLVPKMTILRDTPFPSQVPQIMTLDGPHQQNSSARLNKICAFSPSKLCLNVPFPSICSLKKSPSHQICHKIATPLQTALTFWKNFAPSGLLAGGGWEKERKILSYYRKRQSFTFSKLAKNIRAYF